MKKYPLLTLACILLWTGHANAQNPAGIILYFKSGNDIYLLLAEDTKKTRGWSAFGGGAHEGETPAETAARETSEETNGYFSRTDLLKKIENQNPVTDGKGFVQYFVEIDFVPAPRVTNHPPNTTNRSYFERGLYAWIPYSEIEKYVQTDIDRERKYPIDKKFLPLGSQTSWLWPTGLRNIRKAVETNTLPWNLEPSPMHRPAEEDMQ